MHPEAAIRQRERATAERKSVWNECFMVGCLVLLSFKVKVVLPGRSIPGIVEPVEEPPEEGFVVNHAPKPLETGRVGRILEP